MPPPKHYHLYYLYSDEPGPPLSASRLQSMLEVLLREYDRVFLPPTVPNNHPPP